VPCQHGHQLQDTVAQTGGQQGHREWMLLDRRVVILHQFIKKSEKNPLNELKIARNRMKEVKDAKHSESF
jgi:hypothetical protein